MDRFLYEVWRYITSAMGPFLAGGLCFSIATYFLTKKVFRMSYHRKVRRTNLYLRELRYKSRLLSGLTEQVHTVRNLIKEFSYQFDEKAVFLDELKERISEIGDA